MCLAREGSSRVRWGRGRGCHMQDDHVEHILAVSKYFRSKRKRESRIFKLFIGILEAGVDVHA